jgi:hypothetical protein
MPERLQMPINETSKRIQRPHAAMVRGADGEERVQMFLPIVRGDEQIWITAFDEATNDLASQLLLRGDHGRNLKDIRTCLLAHLDRGAMSTCVAREFTRRLNVEIQERLQLDFDLRFHRVDASSLGMMELLIVTSRITDAGTVFNFNASLDPSGTIERLRERTGFLRQWDWGALLHRFVGLIDDVTGNVDDVYSRLLRNMRQDGAIRQAMVCGLDQKGLKGTLYGDAPRRMAEVDGTLH